MKRYQESKQTHFVTFSCYRRLPLLASSYAKHIFESGLERVRRRYGLRIYGYVVMPEHVHLLVGEPDQGNLAQAIKSLKQGTSRQLIGETKQFWQKRYYDFNVHSERKFIEKLQYLHRNPVKRELCERPEDWRWSSFLHYAIGLEGTIEIESQWTATKRERAGVHLITQRLPHSSQQKA